MPIRGAVTGLFVSALAIVIVAAAGIGICRLAHWNVHGSDLRVAAIVSFAAIFSSQILMLLLLGFDGVDAAQAGLAGLVGLMLMTVAFAAAATLLGLVDQKEPFVLWLLMFSWASLLVVSGTAIVAIKARTKKRREDAVIKGDQK